MPVAADIPGTFDVLINGQGYCMDKSFDDSPFRRPPAQYSYTQTFLDRTNVSGNYGENTQSFFLTASQNDWSLGERRKFFRSNDADGIRRYWYSSALDTTSLPGQASLLPGVTTLAFGEAVVAVTPLLSTIYASGATTLYSVVSGNSSPNNNGAHGLGAAPSRAGLANDGVNVFLSTTTAGTVGVRKFSALSVFSTFSATGADALAFLNNVLYGYQNSTGRLIEYTTGGVASTLFTWQDAAGNAITGINSVLRSYGGVLHILRTVGTGGRTELWQYDGTSISQLAEFPAGFVGQNLTVGSGISFVGGYSYGVNSRYRPEVHYYINGSVGSLWKSSSTEVTNRAAAVSAFAEGAILVDPGDSANTGMQYNEAYGGLHTLVTGSLSGFAPFLSGCSTSFLVTADTVGYSFPSTSIATSGVLQTSLFDFDNSLLKYPRGVKVEFDSATDGNGGTVDVAYQFNSVDGSYTSLQTNVVSGTEYTLPTTQFHSISIQATLNKGTSTNGPVLKRISVSASPILTSYRTNTYLLDLSGNKNSPLSPGYVKLVTGVDHNKDGEEMRADLQTAIAAGPISITDRFGTFTGIIDPGQTTFREVRSQYGRAEYRCELAVRQIQ